MGFEISGISYDPSRKLTRIGKLKKDTCSDTGTQYTFNMAIDFLI